MDAPPSPSYLEAGSAAAPAAQDAPSPPSPPAAAAGRPLLRQRSRLSIPSSGALADKVVVEGMSSSARSSRHNLAPAADAPQARAAAAAAPRRRRNHFFAGDVMSADHGAALERQRSMRRASRSSSSGSLPASRHSWAATATSAGGARPSDLEAPPAGAAPPAPRAAMLRRALTLGLGRRRRSDGSGGGAGASGAPASVATSGRDLASMASLGEQLLAAAAGCISDAHALESIESSLHSNNVDRRERWLNRVFGTMADDDDGDGGDDGGGGAAAEVALHPTSPFRLRWDALVAAVIVYQVAVVPVRVAWGDNAPGGLFAAELLMSAVLLADAALSFHTGFEDQGVVVMDAARVRRRYARTWLAPDVLSALPYGVAAVALGGADARSPGSLRLRAPRLLALLRWPQLWRAICRWEAVLRLDSVALLFAKYGLAAAMFVHTAAALVALQAFAQRDFYSDRYVVAARDAFFTRPTYTLDGWTGAPLLGRPPATQYAYCLFRAVAASVGTCGWGPSAPGALGELWLMLGVNFVGNALKLVATSAVIALVRSHDRSSTEFMHRLHGWRRLLAARDAPRPLRERVLRQVRARHPNGRVLKEDALLRDLPPSMRAELRAHDARRALRGQPVLALLPPAVARALAAELAPLAAAPGDAIFRKGDVADAMYFVADGAVAFVDPDAGGGPRTLAVAGAGAFFGEMPLLSGGAGPHTRTADAVALSRARVFALPRLALYRVGAHFPELMRCLALVAAARGAANANEAVRAADLVAIQRRQQSLLMHACRAAVAQAIVEEEEDYDADGGGGGGDDEPLDAEP